MDPKIWTKNCYTVVLFEKISSEVRDIYRQREPPGVARETMKCLRVSMWPCGAKTARNPNGHLQYKKIPWKKSLINVLSVIEDWLLNLKFNECEECLN